MTTQNNSLPLLAEIMQAHGGWQHWQSVGSIEAAFSSGGLAFASRMQPFALRDLKITVLPHAGKVTLHGYSGPGKQGIWTPEQVSIVDGHGTVIRERDHPRAALAGFRKQLRWDKLDLLYFAGYALWNYLSFPYFLGLPGVSVKEQASSTPERKLVATFDNGIATHSRAQIFHIDGKGLLRRHDYTADVIGSWAHAANLCLESTEVSGFRFYTRRRVFPRFGENTILPFPTLVWIAIDDIRVTTTGDNT